MSRPATDPAPEMPTGTTDPELRRRMGDYLQQLRWSLAPLPGEDREEVVRETHSHFLDRLTAAESPDFATLSAELGAPEIYARRYLESFEISAALASNSPLRMLRVALGLAGRGVLWFFGMLGLGCLYLISLAFLSIALLKPVFPEQVGLWIGGRSVPFLFGFIGGDTGGARELLGYWAIPVALAAAMVTYLLTTRMLRRFLARMRR